MQSQTTMQEPTHTPLSLITVVADELVTVEVLV